MVSASRAVEPEKKTMTAWKRAVAPRPRSQIFGAQMPRSLLSMEGIHLLVDLMGVKGVPQPVKHAGSVLVLMATVMIVTLLSMHGRSFSLLSRAERTPGRSRVRSCQAARE